MANSDASSDLTPMIKTVLQHYNPSAKGTDSIPWVTKEPSPSPGRYWCPAVGIVRDTIYLLGGRGGVSGSSIKSVYGYDITSNTWVTTLPDLLIERRAGAGGQVGNKIYVCGGRNTAGTTLNTCEEYDIDTKTVSTKANMPSGRWACSGAAIGNKVYIFGSESNSNILLEYNTVTDSWRSISPTPRPSGRGWTAVAAAGGKLYVCGGSGATILNDCWEFNPTTETWTQKANMPGPRTYHSAIGSGDNIYVIGGNAVGGQTVPADSIVYKYTISTNSWVTETPIPTSRGWEMLAVNQNMFYVMCGSNCLQIPTYLTVNEAGTIPIGIGEDTRDDMPTTILNTVKPNPVLKGSAHISFSLAKKGEISISIYDATGRMVRNLVNSSYEAGEYTISWDGKNDYGVDLMSGIYFNTIETPGFKSTQKIVLMR